MSGYTKLFRSLLTSTIWRENHPTRIVWMTMLADADQHGKIEASIPGLAALANVTLEECEAALAVLMRPDKYSRTKEHDGRRIEETDGGWRLLNHQKYRELRSEDDRREYQRKWVGDKRRQLSTVDKSRQCLPPSTQAEAEAEAERGESAPPPSSSTWNSNDWLRAFSVAWCANKGVISYGRGDSDSRACGELHDLLGSLDPDERAQAQARAADMFAAYFAIASAGKNGHPFKWFVERFNQLRATDVKARPVGKVTSAPEPRKWRTNGAR